MDLTTYTDSLRDDLTAAAALGDEQTRRTAAALATSVEPALRLTLMTALSDLSAEITAALGDRVVEVRLDGRDVRVVVTGDAAGAEPAAAPGPRSVEDVTGDISRVTLRVVEQVKARAEEAANREGVSLNSWLSQAVQGALREPGGRPRPDTDGGGSLRGWVRG
jgi:hypothetical protein